MPFIFFLLFLESLYWFFLGTYFSPSDDKEVLKSFYKNVKTMGLVESDILRNLKEEDPTFEKTMNFAWGYDGTVQWG